MLILCFIPGPSTASLPFLHPEVSIFCCWLVDRIPVPCRSPFGSDLMPCRRSTNGGWLLWLVCLSGNAYSDCAFSMSSALLVEAEWWSKVKQGLWQWTWQANAREIHGKRARSHCKFCVTSDTDPACILFKYRRHSAHRFVSLWRRVRKCPESVRPANYSMFADLTQTDS